VGLNVLLTGAAGFLGKNLAAAMAQRAEWAVFPYDLGDGAAALQRGIEAADVVVHLAGVNRPERPEQFEIGNVAFLEEVLQGLGRTGKRAKVILSSSIQAERENPYGISKRRAEDALRRHCEACSAEGVAYRFKNLFGKWCRPNYNSVVATFCDAIANGRPYQVSDPGAVVDLTYIDDAVAALLGQLEAPPQPGFRFAEPLPSHRITLGELVTLLKSFAGHRTTLVLPDYSKPLVRDLYATYLSHLPAGSAGYGLKVKADDRGSLAEFIKSPHLGQVFISRTRPGVTRGNHYHHTKSEKFMVVQGEGLVRLRQIHGTEVLEFRCRGEDYRVVDMLPGYTHSIENVGAGEMVTIFWASELFDPARPDTIYDPVLRPQKA
jgi:UDP-2-acetamido-2,6-beta-L-arabino-hexul-4-ose reductase